MGTDVVDYTTRLSFLFQHLENREIYHSYVLGVLAHNYAIFLLVGQR